MRHTIFQQPTNQTSTVGVIPLIVFSPSAIALAYACFQTGICPDGEGSDEEQAALACLQAGGTFDENGGCVFPGIETGAGTIQDKIDPSTGTATTTPATGTGTPKSGSSGGGGGYKGAPVPTSGSSTTTTPYSPASKYNWPVIAAVAGVLAVGGAFAYKKYAKKK